MRGNAKRRRRRKKDLVPPPGEEATVVLGPNEAHVRVKVLGVVRQTVVHAGDSQMQRIIMRLVCVQIPGEKEPWEIAVERFVEVD